MATTAIKLHAHRRDDGRLYITSSDLPGFRFLAEPEEDYRNELLADLREFYAVYKAAKAKLVAQAEARRIALRGGAISHSPASKEDFDMEAQFEMAWSEVQLGEMSQSGQEKIDIIEGHRLLREAGYEPVPGSNSHRREFWIGPDGLPEDIPYAGPPPYGRYLDKPSLDEVLRKARASNPASVRWDGSVLENDAPHLPAGALALNLPSTPLKESERRGDRWREIWGHEQTEIDAAIALAPDALAEILRDAVKPFYDPTLIQRSQAVRSEWANREIRRYYDLPIYAEAREAIDLANDEVREAHAALHDAIAAANDVQQEWSDAINAAIEEDPPSEPPVDTVEPNLAPAPEPIFTTDDEYATATRKLIDRKQLAGEGAP